ncbi:MAG: TIR domain-containing protein [Ignavibacteriae bacterium]|nr:TIR domain-containing protein [Ignavibacteriota bacterium]
MKYVFISYSHKNKQRVYQIKEFLESNGIKTWIDEKGIGGGDSIPGEIAEALNNATAFICLISSAYMKSKFCLRELEMAMNTNKTIIPLRLDRTPFIPNLTLIIGTTKYIDLTSYRTYQHKLKEVISSIENIGITSTQNNLNHHSLPFLEYILIVIQHHKKNIALLVLLLLTIFLISIFNKNNITKTNQQHELSYTTKRILILPFEQIGDSTDLNTTYGITKGLNDYLAEQLPNVGISVFTLPENADYKTFSNKQSELAEFVIIGDVQRLEDHLNIKILFGNTMNDSLLWKKDYSPIKIEDIEYAIYYDCYKQISEKLGLPIEARLIEKYETRAWDAFNEGLNYGRKPKSAQENKLSMRNYQKSVEIDPDFYLAYCHLAGSQLFQYQNFDNDSGWISKAERNLNKAFQLDSSRAEVYWHRGRILEIRNQKDSALNLYNQALKRNPNLYQVYLYIGNIYFQQNKYQEAFEQFKKAYQLNRVDHLTIMNLGATSIELEQYSEAIHYLNKALTLDSTEELIFSNLALSYQKNHDFRNADENYRKAYALDPENTLNDYSEFLLITEQFTVADSLLSLPLSTTKTTTVLKNYHRGFVKYFLRQENLAKQFWKHALTIINELLKQNINDQTILRLRALCYSALNNKEKSLYFGKQILLSDSTNIEHVLLMAKIHANLSEKEKMFEWIKKAYNIEPSTITQNGFNSEVEFIRYQHDPSVEIFFSVHH